MTRAWMLLVVAGLLEVGWAVGLKYTGGFTRPWPTAGTVVGMIASVFFLALAVQRIPLGTGYVVWTGIGAVGTSVLGMVLFGEVASAARLAWVGVILVGIVGLKMTSGD